MTQPDMTGGRWIAFTVSLVLGLAAVACLVNYGINFYGCYGNAHGKSRSIFASHDERGAKYLLSMNYVPSNFDGLLVGTSVTDNWNTRLIRGARVYNGSISGGNISEAKLIADNVLSRSKLRVVLFVSFPYLTESGGIKGGAMQPHLYWEALGSFRLLASYAEWMASALHLARNEVDDYGVWRYEAAGIANSASWAAGKDAVFKYDFSIDPVAYRDYKELIREARANGALLVRLRAPIYRGTYDARKSEFSRYYEQIDSMFEPADPVIDFNGPAYEKFRGDRSNFLDGSHLTNEAAAVLTVDIDHELQHLLRPLSLSERVSMITKIAGK